MGYRIDEDPLFGGQKPASERGTALSPLQLKQIEKIKGDMRFLSEILTALGDGVREQEAVKSLNLTGVENESRTAKANRHFDFEYARARIEIERFGWSLKPEWIFNHFAQDGIVKVFESSRSDEEIDAAPDEVCVHYSCKPSGVTHEIWFYNYPISEINQE